MNNKTTSNVNASCHSDCEVYVTYYNVKDWNDTHDREITREVC